MTEPHYPHRNVAFIGGIADGCRGSMRLVPKFVKVGAEWYERLDDPDTGEFLGGYTPRKRVFSIMDSRAELIGVARL